MRGGSVAFGLAALLAGANPAAADARGQAVSISLGYGTFSIPDHSPDGTTLALDYELALGDVVFLRASGGVGVYFGEQRSYSGMGVVGLTYHVDVLRYVPYASVGVGGIAIGGGDIETTVHPLLELGGGLDVRHSTRFAYGVLARFETFVQETSFLTVGARVSFLF
jgi:hypothetical protein